jgi:hypothetical protein
MGHASKDWGVHGRDWWKEEMLRKEWAEKCGLGFELP